MSHIILKDVCLNYKVKKDIKFNFHKAKEICLLGSSAFAIQLGFSLVTYILNTVLKKYGGDTSIGAMAIVQSFMTFYGYANFWNKSRDTTNFRI